MDAAEQTYVDPAIARYDRLVNALGGVPVSGYERAVLSRLCAWSDDADITALAGMIARSRRAQEDRP